MDIFSNEMYFLFSVPFITTFLIKTIEIIKKSYIEDMPKQIFTVGAYAVLIYFFSYVPTGILLMMVEFLGDFVPFEVYYFFISNEDFATLIWTMSFSVLFSILYFQKINLVSCYRVRYDGLTDYERNFYNRILKKRTVFYNNLYSSKSEKERKYYVKQWIMDRREKNDIYMYEDGDVSLKYGYFHEKMSINYKINPYNKTGY
ncbi:hypothetical protein I6E17_03665 [Fusobacterium perfoetens]|uniref:hypothetical protein n=1 Tax=Fusobacterium perfoetens TaxID=852 RepID=UPI001F383898|nr:hypothetical protein [Fusobacterium perfoetens]MCF2625278.1 hypothetical protein [Fusobacterium perfoetens]